MKGIVYLLHFVHPIGSGKYGKAQHYTGWAKDAASLQRRIEQHRKGKGAKITAYVASQEYNDMIIASTALGDRHLERRLKNQGGAKRRCPICKNIYHLPA